MAYFLCGGNNGDDYSGKIVTATSVGSDKTQLCVTIPYEGQYDTSSVVAVPQVKLQNVYYLGTGTSYNIKTLFPALYAKLTASNFIAMPTGVSASASSHWEVKATVYSYNDNRSLSANTSITPSISYNSSTGALTINGTYNAGSDSYSNWTTYQDQEQGSAGNVSVTLGVSYKVYAILGSIANA